MASRRRHGWSMQHCSSTTATCHPRQPMSTSWCSKGSSSDHTLVRYCLLPGGHGPDSSQHLPAQPGLRSTRWHPLVSRRHQGEGHSVDRGGGRFGWHLFVWFITLEYEMELIRKPEVIRLLRGFHEETIKAHQDRLLMLQSGCRHPSTHEGQCSDCGKLLNEEKQ